MKRKITYALITVAIGLAAFFAGKINNAEAAAELELVEFTAEGSGLYLEYADGTEFYSFWIPEEMYGLDTDAGFQLACNFAGKIVDWNTSGEELAIFTEDGYEFYAYKTEDIYK